MELANALGALQAAARRIAEVSKECKMEVDAGECSLPWGRGRPAARALAAARTQPTHRPPAHPTRCASAHADTYVQSFRPSMMNVIYQWSKGASFADVCKLTTLFEGTIIRCAARAVGARA